MLGSGCVMPLLLQDNILPPEPTTYKFSGLLTSPTGGGRSVCIIRSRTKAAEFFFILHHTFPYFVIFPLATGSLLRGKFPLWPGRTNFHWHPLGTVEI